MVSPRYPVVLLLLPGRDASSDSFPASGTCPPVRAPSIWTMVLAGIPLLQGNLWDQNLKNSPFKSANPGVLGVPRGYQNPADASAPLKNLAPAVIAQLVLPEQVEELLGCLSLGLRLPGLSSPPRACLCKPSIALLFSARYIFKLLKHSHET